MNQYQLINFKHKIEFLIYNDTSSQQIQPVAKLKPKYKFEKCVECKKRRKPSEENHKICRSCYRANVTFNTIEIGNKVIDDFIKYTQINNVYGGKMEIVSYDSFKDVEFIGEGGFSKVYKAIWIDGPIKKIDNWNEKEKKYKREPNKQVALKKLNNSKNFTFKELNEIKISYKLRNFIRIIEYYGITQDPITKDFVIIMSYCDSGDLIRYIAEKFYNLSWYEKLIQLHTIVIGLKDIHNMGIIHRDLHSGNILIQNGTIRIGDLGLSKSATEAGDNETYGIIPYMAPEILQGQRYTTASDIYSFGMIMWECMTGRRPFRDRAHDTDLIIDICDGLRPPIDDINAPKGYIEIMKECWDPDPSKRPASGFLEDKFYNIRATEWDNDNKTVIVESSDIGPITTNNPGAIYKSRSLSSLIKSAESTRSIRSQSISSDFGKRKFESDHIENNNDEGNKKIKLLEDEPYRTRALEYDL